MENKQKTEAMMRLKELTEKYELNPNIAKYFEEGRLYYSYYVIPRFMASIDTITYDPAYEKAVKDFEERHPGYLVYHAIESKTNLGRMLSLLYVSPNEDEWEWEHEDGGFISAYTANIDEPDESEFGDVGLVTLENSGALLRRF